MGCASYPENKHAILTSKTESHRFEAIVNVNTKAPESRVEMYFTSFLPILFTNQLLIKELIVYIIVTATKTMVDMDTGSARLDVDIYPFNNVNTVNNGSEFEFPANEN